jgi:hypothetical protein
MGREVLPIEYEYRGETSRFGLVVCDQQIATICQPIENEEGFYENYTILRQGMSLDEIEENFPPTPLMAKQGKTYSLMDLIRSIIYEEFQNSNGMREPGNVRHFWYTHLKYIMDEVLGIGETESVKTAINRAWADLVVSGLVTYEGLNITSAKENIRHSAIRDSPFSDIIVAVEKEDLFDKFKWIPKLFNCTLIAGGGQPSRAVARSFILDLSNNGVDLDQHFFMCVISDLDPDGYYIQEAFKSQLESAIQFYGGSGSIEIRRLFVRKDQISQKLIDFQAMPYGSLNIRKESVRKAEDTKWEWFCSVTDGGVYKAKDGVEQRARLELDAFGSNTIEKSIVRELLDIIHQTNDESMIMIPEIMRVFNELRLDVIKDLAKRHRDAWLQPIIDDYLSQTDALERDLRNETEREVDSENERYQEATAPTREKYSEQRDRVNSKTRDRRDVQEDLIEDYRIEKGFRKTLDYIDEQIEMLERLRSIIDDQTAVEMEDAFNEIDLIEEEGVSATKKIDEMEESEMVPFNEEHRDLLQDLRNRHLYRMRILDLFRQEKTTKFGPLEQEVLRQVSLRMSIEEMRFWYVDLEGDHRTRPHISRLMTDPDALMVDEISAWDQAERGSTPVFAEDDLLQQASERKDEHVGMVRRGFTPAFQEAMVSILQERGEDLGSEIGELHERIKRGIDDGEHNEEE